MWHGFVGQRIAATAKTLKRIGVALILAAVALAAYGARTFVNVMKGPINLDEKRLQAIANPNLVFRDYATVEGRQVTLLFRSLLPAKY